MSVIMLESFSERFTGCLDETGGEHEGCKISWIQVQAKIIAVWM